MPQEIWNIVLAALGTIITGLASWGLALLTTWLNSKIKDKKLAEFLTKITTIITDAVKQIYQEFVEVLKKEGKFDEVAQAEAKARAITIIKAQLTPELNDFIKENYGELETWISNKIESVLYNLKNCDCK